MCNVSDISSIDTSFIAHRAVQREYAVLNSSNFIRESIQYAHRLDRCPPQRFIAHQA